MTESKASRLLRALDELVRREQGAVAARSGEALAAIQGQIGPVIQALAGSAELPPGAADELGAILSFRGRTAEQIGSWGLANRARNFALTELRARLSRARSGISPSRAGTLDATA